MHCTYCGICQKAPLGTKATSNSEKIKPVALAVVELRLSEGISQLLSQSLENSFYFILLNSVATCLKHFGLI